MWLKKYPDGGKVEKPKPKFSIKNDPLRPQGLGIQSQDNLRPLPLIDVKAVDDSNTLPAKFNKSLVRAKQQAKGQELRDAEIARRKALIDKSNTEGGFKNSAVAEKMRVFPNSAGGWGEIFDDYVNLPRVLIGQSADALGHAKTTTDYAKAIAMPLAIGATGYSPVNTAANIIKSPITQALASAPGKVFDAAITNNSLKEFNTIQSLAPIVDDATYNTLRNVNKAGNLYKNDAIPLDQRIYQMVNLNIPEENIIRMTGKTRQQLLQDASEFQNIKKAREESPGLDNRNYTSINLERPRRARLDAESRRALINDLPPIANEIIIPNRLTDFNVMDIPNIDANTFGEMYDLYSVPTSRMRQMQKANDINERVYNYTQGPQGIISKKFSKQYIPTYDEMQDVKSLVPSISREMDANAQNTIANKVSQISGGKSGELYKGASSLSDGSFPAYIKNLQKQVQSGTGEPLYGGHTNLNSLGFLKRAGVNNTEIAGYLNKHIENFNKATGKNIPKAYTQGDEIMYPDVIFKKFGEGGTIKNWLNKY